MSGSPVLALKRAKAKQSAGGVEGDAYASQMLQDDDGEGPMVSRAAFNEMRKETLDETISEAGSDEDEPIPLDDAEPAQQANREPSTAGEPVSEVDMLVLLMSDTPMEKLRVKEKDADRSFNAGDLWTSLRLRQEILGLAKLYGPTAVYGRENKFPMLLADAHFKLAKAYAALQCLPQASTHCNKALEAMPPFGLSHKKVVTFKEDVNILLGETLLKSVPPKPQAALQYMYAAAGTSSTEEIKDLGIKLIVSQCFYLLGVAKLEEATATRNAHDALEQRIAALMEKQAAEVKSKSPEYERLATRIRETKNELREEEQFEAVLIDEAKTHLEKAVDVLMGVIDVEAERLRDKLGHELYKEDPLIKTLYRQSSQICLKSALVAGLAGDIKGQIRDLEEIDRAQAQYNCVPFGLMSRALKEHGAAYVAKAKNSEEGAGDADLDKAVAKYKELAELQSQHYSQSSAKQAIALAETNKLLGNVYVAKRLWSRAVDNYQKAMDVFASYLGPDSNLVLDLEHRINEVRSYTEA